MDCILRRQSYNDWGIVSTLSDSSGNQLAVTLEHAYQADDGSWGPKIPPGQYRCEIGTHQLGSGGPQQLFQVMGVPGHTNILLHKGNFDKDSEGCVLLGESLGDKMVCNSGQAFDAFMALQAGQPFTLTVP
jgi:hypothetical protein